MLSDRAQASYHRALASQFGPSETITLRRLAGTGAGDYDVNAWVTAITVAELGGSVQQLLRTAIILADDVVDSGFPTPFLPKQDRVVWNDRVMSMSAINNSSRRVQGELLAYEVELAGA